MNENKSAPVNDRFIMECLESTDPESRMLGIFLRDVVTKWEEVLLTSTAHDPGLKPFHLMNAAGRVLSYMAAQILQLTSKKSFREEAVSVFATAFEQHMRSSLEIISTVDNEDGQDGEAHSQNS